MMTFVIFSTSRISSFTTQVISRVKILSFHPEDSFLKVLVTLIFGPKIECSNQNIGIAKSERNVSTRENHPTGEKVIHGREREK